MDSADLAEISAKSRRIPTLYEYISTQVKIQLVRTTIHGHLLTISLYIFFIYFTKNYIYFVAAINYTSDKSYSNYIKFKF